MSHRPPWPAEREALLRRLLRQGMSDHAIADRMGVTHRAVIGKRERLGLKCNPLQRSKKGDTACLTATSPQECAALS